MVRRAFHIALIVGTLVGCTHHPTIGYPRLVDAGPIEAGFGCPALDDAILKTEAVRWVMRQDGARLISPEERTARIGAELATDLAAAAACFLCSSPVNLGEEGHSALDNADHRLLSLLRLKKEKSCPARPTGVAGLTDVQMYDAVVALIAEEASARPNRPVGELRVERMHLLDQLRP